MLDIHFTKQMHQGIKRMAKRGKDLGKLEAVIDMIANGEKLPNELSDHKLSGDLRGYRECHIENDWLLIYKVIEDRLMLVAVNTGNHSDLFGE